MPDKATRQTSVNNKSEKSQVRRCKCKCHLHARIAHSTKNQAVRARATVNKYLFVSKPFRRPARPTSSILTSARCETGPRKATNSCIPLSGIPSARLVHSIIDSSVLSFSPSLDLSNPYTHRTSPHPTLVQTTQSTKREARLRRPTLQASNLMHLRDTTSLRCPRPANPNLASSEPSCHCKQPASFARTTAETVDSVRGEKEKKHPEYNTPTFG